MMTVSMQLLLCIIALHITTVPVIVQFPEDTYVQEGEGVLFHVKVTGVPHPNLTWYHNGVEVKEDYSRDLSEDGSLIMPSAESKHSGVYKLVVHNTAGRVEREVRLTVEEENHNKPVLRPGVPMAAIPVSQFENHVERDHKRSNQGFKEEYQVAGYFAMLCNVALCIIPSNSFSHCMMERNKTTSIATNAKNKLKNNMCVCKHMHLDSPY